MKNDPRHVAAARELRDRWLEQVNAGSYAVEAQGKYDVGRIIGAGVSVGLARPAQLARLLPAA